MKWIKAAAFSMIGIGLFLVVQAIFTPNWHTSENVDWTIHGFHELEDDTIDVLFVGTSTVEQGFSPMKLYDDLGLCAYSLASSGQPLTLSYYVLKDAFLTQSPAVVILDAGELSLPADKDPWDYSWRFQLDNRDLSSIKVEMAEAYEERIDIGDKWNVLIPMAKFHDRWNELRVPDFEIVDYSSYYSAGQFIQNGVSGTQLTREYIDSEVGSIMSDREGTKTEIRDGVMDRQDISTALYSTEYYENNLNNNMDKLLRISDLCKENGAELLLVKAQVMSEPSLKEKDFGDPWNHAKYLILKETMERIGIPFFDLAFDTDTGIDFTNDSWDAGNHLNVRGADKETQALEDYLLCNYDLKVNTDNKQYNENLEKYKKVSEVAYMQSELDFDTYLERLLAKENDLSILITAKDDYRTSLNKKDISLLRQLGLELAEKGNAHDSYMAVIEGGEVRYEAVSDRKFDYNATILDDTTVSMVSAGRHLEADGSVTVNGFPNSMNGQGLNFVVIDNETGIVIDSVYFDTSSEERSAMREVSNVYERLRAYEAAVCFE